MECFISSGHQWSIESARKVTSMNSNETYSDYQRSFGTGENVNNLFDLPTHLPNDEPQNHIEETPTTHEQPNDDEKYEDEENATATQASSSQPIFIQGTNISLQTEEDIKKWIEERKKRWPTRQNVAMKQSQEENDQTGAKRGAPDNNNSPRKKTKNICRFFQQHGHCKFGNKCKNSHEAAPKSSSGVTLTNEFDSTHFKRQINGVPVLIPKLYSQRPTSSANSSSLFKSLVKKEHYENENSIILDFVQFLDQKGLINHDVMKK